MARDFPRQREEKRESIPGISATSSLIRGLEQLRRKVCAINNKYTNWLYLCESCRNRIANCLLWLSSNLVHVRPLPGYLSLLSNIYLHILTPRRHTHTSVLGVWRKSPWRHTHSGSVGVCCAGSLQRFSGQLFIPSCCHKKSIKYDSIFSTADNAEKNV